MSLSPRDLFIKEYLHSSYFSHDIMLYFPKRKTFLKNHSKKYLSESLVIYTKVKQFLQLWYHLWQTINRWYKIPLTWIGYLPISIKFVHKKSNYHEIHTYNMVLNILRKRFETIVTIISLYRFARKYKPLHERMYCNQTVIQFKNPFQLPFHWNFKFHQNSNC